MPFLMNDGKLISAITKTSKWALPVRNGLPKMCKTEHNHVLKKSKLQVPFGFE